MSSPFRAVDAIVLAGGRGTRLQTAVSHVPKPLAEVGGRPFLDYQLDLLARSDLVAKTVLALGYLADRVMAHYDARPPRRPLRYVVEQEPLGTGGGARHALDATDSRHVLVINGDSLFRWDLERMLDDHLRLGAAATLALVQAPDVSRYGAVTVDGQTVRAFAEKGGASGPGLINAGVYLFERSALSALAAGRPASLEQDVFPMLTRDGALAATLFDTPFIDIGLPETYRAAQAVVGDMISIGGDAA